MQINFNIEKFLDLTGYAEIRKDRRKIKNGETNKKGTQEFFTPYSIIKRMAIFMVNPFKILY